MVEQKRRKDQWTITDDEKLAEIVISNVQNGRTQLTLSEHDVDMALEILGDVLSKMEPTAPKEQA